MHHKPHFFSGIALPVLLSIILGLGLFSTAMAATITMKGQITGSSQWVPQQITVPPRTSMVINAFYSGTCPSLPPSDSYWLDVFISPNGVTPNGSFPLSYDGTPGPCQQGYATDPLTYTFNNLGTYRIKYQLWTVYCSWSWLEGWTCQKDRRIGRATYVVKVVKTIPVQALQITASLYTYASTCVPDTITVTALDAQSNPVATTGILSLTTSSKHGNWTLVPGSGNGTFSPGSLDSGTATYQYAAADNGTAQFTLADVHADNLVVKGTLTPPNISSQSGTIKFRYNAFVFTQTAPPGDGAGVVVAGRPEAIKVEMIRRDPNTGSCRPAPGYTYTNSVKAWIQRTASDPGGIAPTVSGVVLGNAAPATNNLLITFTNGVANFTLATTDVGQYNIVFRDNTSKFAVTLTGAARAINGSTSQPLTVRPFALAFQAIQAGGTTNPGGTTPAATVFTAAGRAFSATLEAVLWQNGDPTDGLPTGPVSASGRAVTPHFTGATTLSAAGPFQPTQGTLGTLTGGNVAPTTWSGGTATDAQVAYSEVGSMTVKATAASYLDSANAVVGGLSTPVGRFIPDHFAVSLNTPQFATACTSSNPGFSYLGQLFFYRTKPVATLTAENVQGGITKNYNNFTAQGGGNWFRLVNSSLPATVYTDAGTHPIDTAGLTVNGANPVIANPSQGVATLSFSAGAGLDYTRPATPEAPFNASPTLAQQVADLDGVKSTPDPVAFSAIPFSGGAAMRYGRISLKNAYGSELLALPVPMQAQYYQDAGNGFVTHTADACTTGITVSLTNYQGNLVSGTTQATLIQPPTAGVFDLGLSAPGAGNTGSVIVTAKVPSWLQYDWTSSALTNPAALAVFGLYEGSPYQIFLQEIY